MVFFNRQLIALLFLLSLLFFVTAAGYADTKNHPKKTTSHCLNITDFRRQKLLLRWRLDSSYFALSFVHSVSETPVVDYYRLDKQNNIIQIAERFEHHGAGLPSNVTEGTEWQHRNGYFWLSMQRPIKQLIIRTDIDYQNRLHPNKQPDNNGQLSQSVNLNQWADTALWLRPVTCP